MVRVTRLAASCCTKGSALGMVCSVRRSHGIPVLLFLYSAAFRIGTYDPRVRRMPLPGVESMKPKGYMLRHFGPGQLRVRGCVQYEQKRSVLASIEHDREDDAFVF